MQTDSAERGGSNLETKRKRLSIVFTRFLTAKQGAGRAEQAQAIDRDCATGAEGTEKGGRSKPLPYRDRCGSHRKRTVEDACPYKICGFS